MRSVILVAMLSATAASAADAPKCAEGMVCAERPQSVVAALQAAGYKAVLKANAKGHPFIASATNGDEFTLNFDDCDDAKANCQTLYFFTWYKKAAHLDAALANKFNAGQKYGRAYVDGDGDFVLDLYLTTTGGITQENFKDVVNWWTVSDADLGKMVEEAEAAGESKPAATQSSAVTRAG